MPLLLATSSPHDLLLPLTQAPQLSRHVPCPWAMWRALTSAASRSCNLKDWLCPATRSCLKSCHLPICHSHMLWGPAGLQWGGAYQHPDSHLLLVILASCTGTSYGSQGHHKVTLWLSKLVIGSNLESQHSFFFDWWFLYQPFVACGQSAMTLTKALSLNWCYLFSLRLKWSQII